VSPNWKLSDVTVDSGYYEAQRRGVENQYATNMAANAYSQTMARNRGNRDLELMQSTFKRGVPSFTSGFGQRGFGGGIKSGVMQQSMSNYLGDFQRTFSGAQSDLTESLRQYDLSAAQMGAQRTSALADLELEKAREISFAAQNIAALREMFGGM
jgi:hypothetical protein